MADEENKGYRVEDRRFIHRQEQGAQEPTAQEPKTEPKAEETKAQEAQAKEPKAKRPHGPLPPLTLSTFVFSLNTSALVHLGEYPDPTTGQTGTDLDLAKQTIDLLGLLKDKTKGNLSPDEEQLLDAVLFDLRMRFLKVQG